MGHNYNLRRSKQMLEPEVPSPPPPPAVAVDDNGDVMESGPQAGALRNELIMAEVFRHLSLEDLRECRLVNQVWSQVATRVLAPNAPVFEFSDKDGIPRMEKMDTFNNTDKLPCRKFKVDSCILFYTSTKQELVLPKFIERVAPTVTHLGVTGRRRLFPWKKPKKGTEYPRLKSLEFNILSMSVVREERLVLVKSNEDFMINIMQNSPNLDSITLLRVGRENADRLIETVPWNKIRHLKVDGEVGDRYFQKIVELGTAMKLKSFEMATYELTDQIRPTDRTAFPKFLDQQSGSLEVLKLKFETWFPEPHPRFRLPGFPKLKTLEAHLSYFDYLGAQHEMYGLLSSPSFSQTFPSLNSVTVTGVRWPDLCTVLRSEDSAPVETVKTLKVDSPRDLWGALHLEQAYAQQVVRHLGQMFPNIRKLVVPSDVVVMKAIEMEQAWQNLKDLTLICGNYRSIDVDCALFGIPPQEYPGYLGRCSNLNDQAVRQEQREIERKIFQFLHNLETLELEVADNTPPLNLEPTVISDLCCYLVILKLRNLKCLNLRGLGSLGTTYQVSKKTIQRMSAKFKVLYKDGKPEEETE